MIDPEFHKIFIGIATAMTILAFLLIRFTGKYSILIMLFACLSIAIILSFLGHLALNLNLSDVPNSGKSREPFGFIKGLVIFFVIPSTLGFLINHGINVLKGSNLPVNKTLVLLVLAISTFIIYRYTAHYEKYTWKAYLINQNNHDAVLISAYLSGIEDKYGYGWGSYINKKPELYDVERLYIHKKKHKDMIDNSYQGMPKSLSILYFSRKDQQFYKGYFSLTKASLSSFMDYNFLYPIIGYQSYRQINLVLKDKGLVALQFGNKDEDITVFEGTCNIVTKDQLSDYEQEKANEKSIVSNTDNLLDKEDFDYNGIFKSIVTNKIPVTFEVTGLTDKIKHIAIISTNGDRFTLDKKKCIKGSPLPGVHSPITTIHLLTLKNKNRYLSWDFAYKLEDLVKVIRKEGTESVKSIDYTFDLYIDKNNLFKAESFVYINNKQYNISPSKMEVSKSIMDKSH